MKPSMLALGAVALGLYIGFGTTAFSMSGDEGRRLEARALAGYQDAAKALKDAADAGDFNARYWQGQLLWQRGQFSPAIEAYKAAADQKNGLAEIRLGEILLEGNDSIHLQKDVAEAKHLLRVGIEHISSSGDVYQLFALALDYYFSNGPFPKDHRKAFQLYGKAADLGSWDAMESLALMYRDGDGVEKDVARGNTLLKKSLDMTRAAAQAGDPDAMDDLVQQAALEEDWATAAQWAFARAEAESPDGFHNLEAVERSGNLLGPDYGRAAPLFRKAAQQARKIGDFDSEEKYSSDAAFAEQQLAELSPHPQAKKVVRTGTGFLVGTAGQILTADHVITGCSGITARFSDTTDSTDGNPFRKFQSPGASNVPPPPPGYKLDAPPPNAIDRDGTVMAEDAGNDLAIVRVAPPFPKSMTFRQGKPIREADDVVAIGFPLAGLLASGANVTVGNVSALAGLGNDTRYLQMTAPVQAGNSGGPLLDRSGHVVGVVTMTLDAGKLLQVAGDIPQNVNFALKASAVMTFLDANGVTYSTAPSGERMDAADVAAAAKASTALLECWQ